MILGQNMQNMALFEQEFKAYARPPPIVNKFPSFIKYTNSVYQMKMLEILE